jgi:N-acetylglutamate synthase-like GNAT family acetyltransferase
VDWEGSTITRDVKIRKAQLKDTVSIRKVARITWRATYQELIPIKIQNQFLNVAYSDRNMKLRIDQTLFFVAEQEGEIVGFANATIKKDDAELSAIYVLPELQGHSIGSRLLQSVLSNLDHAGQLVVDVESGNQIGERFYH